MKSVLKQGRRTKLQNVCTSCLKFLRHEIDYHSDARTIAIQDHRRGYDVFSAI
jgi:hypothetical protein